ncbi:MAG: hypothetical protein FWF27_04630 [Candidatus Bathyarchaeota archaeon]|nr:hypothetical protein [Candidatus Termiticorpusculum sp.]
MSTTVDNNVLKVKNPQSITIGSYTYKNVMVLAMKYVAEDGGEVKIPQTVASGKWPVGWTEKPCYIKLVVLINNAMVERDMWQAGYWGNSTVGEDNIITTLSFVDKHVNGKTRTVTFSPDIGSVITMLDSSRRHLGEQLTELTIATAGPFTIPTF